MICAAGLLDQTVSTTTTTLPGGVVTVPSTLVPPATTTTAGAPSTSATTAGSTISSTTSTTTSTTHATTVTTLAHHAVTTTTVGASGAASNDRGVVHQLFIDAGASKSGAHTAQIYLAAPVKAAVILLIALVLSRLVSRVSHRLVNGLRLVSPLVEATPRGAARVQTLAGAFTSVFRAVIWILAALEVLNELSINLTPFVAGATVIGAALGFGAQSLVKDFLSGILILAEDQYGVGDHIAVGVGANITSGTVESVNLRVTRLRGADGGILYIPNGDIRTLSNDTETDSQALVDIVVPFGTDVTAAGVVAQEAAREMAADPEWAADFVSEPYFAGVQDASSAAGFVLRIMVLTRPGQHMRLAREMRLRIVEHLRRERIAWAATDAPPPVPVPVEELRQAAAQKRAAERRAAEKMVGPAKRAPSARASRKAAKAVAKSVRKRTAEGREEGGGRDQGEAGADPGDQGERQDQPGDAG